MLDRQIAAQRSELRAFLIEDSIRNWLCRLGVSWLEWPYYARHLRTITQRDCSGQQSAVVTAIGYPDGTIEIVEAQFDRYEE